MTAAQAALPLVAGLFCVCCAAQPVSKEPGHQQVKEIVSNVDSHLKTFNKSNAMLQTGTDRGGELTIYRRGSDVVRIDALIGASHSDLQDVFYFSGANVVFVSTRTVTYPYSSISNGFDFAHPRVKTGADCYVRDGKLIPLGRVKITPAVESRLLQEAALFTTAVRRGNQVVDIEKLLK